jgi:alpha-D-xyloside xylohydrolase
VPVPGLVVIEGEHGTLEIDCDPFSITLRDADGLALLETPAEPVDDADAGLTFGTFAALEPTHYYNPAHTDPDSSDRRWVPAWHAAGVVYEHAESSGVHELVVDVDEQVGEALVVTIEPREDVGFRLAFEIREPGVVAFTRLGFTRPADEHFYGLGERLDRTDAAGRAYEMVTGLGNLDSGLNEVHVPVPFYVSDRSYGLFFEDPHPSFFDFGVQAEERVRATWSTSETLVLHVITADSPLEVASRYGRLTGPAALPPIWAFAPFQWRNELDDGAQLVEDAWAIRDSDIPGSCIWIDNPWQTAYNTHLFNTVQFPEPETMLATLEDMGFRNMLWSTPYLDNTDDRWVEGMEPDTGGMFEEALDAGYFITNSDGEPVLMTWSGDRGGGRIDFTNPEAWDYWTDVIGRVTSMGVCGFKLDYGEDTVPGSVLDAYMDFTFASGDTALTMHKLSSILYHRAYREKAIADTGESFILGRSSTYGGQRDCEAIWPGDLDASFLEHREENEDGNPAVGGLPAAIAALQNLSVSGFPAFGSDTGGYRGDDQDKELLVRWAQHTALTPIMQLGGGDHHNVWDMTVYDAETLDIYQRLARLHTRLFPLWYTLANLATDEGVPPIRPLGLVYPDDPDAAAAWDEYMVGEWLLVAPVRKDGARERVVHFPPGTWVHWFTGEVFEGPSDATVDAPLDSLPLFLASGAIVPMIADDVDTFVTTTHAEFVTLEERRDQMWVRILPAAQSLLELFDGGRLGIEICNLDCSDLYVLVEQGTWFSRWVLEIDWENGETSGFSPPTSVTLEGSVLSEETDGALVASAGCDGCWHFDAGSGTLLVSIDAPGTVHAD